MFKKNKLTFSVSILVLCLSVIACSKKRNQDSSPEQDMDLVTYKLDIQVSNENEMSQEKRKLLDNVRNQKPTSFNGISQLLINQEAMLYSEEHQETLQQRINKVLPENNLSSSQPGKVKVAYEEKLQKLLGKELMYNVDQTLLPHPLFESEMQCYSGTLLYQAIRRQMGREEFEKTQPVVILEPGHILPGHMVKIENQWRLIGIETTVSGEGFKDYGWAKDLNTPIAEAGLFAVIHIFEEDIINRKEVRNEAVVFTARKYGIDSDRLLKAMEPVVAAASGSSSSEDGGGASHETEQRGRKTVLGYGTPKNSPPLGSHKRVEGAAQPDSWQETVKVDYVEQGKESSGVQETIQNSFQANELEYDVNKTAVSDPLIQYLLIKDGRAESSTLIGQQIIRPFMSIPLVEEAPKTCERPVRFRISESVSMPKYYNQVTFVKKTGVDQEQKSEEGEKYSKSGEVQCSLSLTSGSAYSAIGDKKIAFFDSKNQEFILCLGSAQESDSKVLIREALVMNPYVGAYVLSFKVYGMGKGENYIDPMNCVTQ